MTSYILNCRLPGSIPRPHEAKIPSLPPRIRWPSALKSMGDRQGHAATRRRFGSFLSLPETTLPYPGPDRQQNSSDWRCLIESRGKRPKPPVSASCAFSLSVESPPPPLQLPRAVVFAHSSCSRNPNVIKGTCRNASKPLTSLHMGPCRPALLALPPPLPQSVPGCQAKFWRRAHAAAADAIGRYRASRRCGRRASHPPHEPQVAADGPHVVC